MNVSMTSFLTKLMDPGQSCALGLSSSSTKDSEQVLFLEALTYSNQYVFSLFTQHMIIELQFCSRHARQTDEALEQNWD